MRLLISLIVAFAPWFAEAQIKYVESVPRVAQSGYYRIALSQEMIGVASTHDFGGIRLIDQRGKAVPFFVDRRMEAQPQQHYSDLQPIALRTDSIASYAVVENTQAIEVMVVQIKSAVASGLHVRIRGSHQATGPWFLVTSQSVSPSSHRHFNADDAVIEVRFPQGNYRFYEVMLTNDQKQPVEIWSVKVPKPMAVPKTDWVLLPFGRHAQIDSLNHKSYLNFPDLKNQYAVAKITFEIASPQHYWRRGYVSNQEFVLSSKVGASVFFERLVLDKGKDLVVENEQSTPLQMVGIKVFGKAVYLCAYISVDDQINIVLDPESKSKPNYDIVHFQNDIPLALPQLTATAFELVPADVVVSTTRWFEKPVFIWVCIIGVGVFLLWICLQIARDLKKNTK
ncbi:hypothetical protein [Flavobacterium sp. JP2137]|uniref:hypothetical protein n=1 Tax=Flavobacterium sp. JP2137 TaxID=3414510 RepID=UPI003D2FA5BA